MSAASILFGAPHSGHLTGTFFPRACFTILFMIWSSEARVYLTLATCNTSLLQEQLALVGMFTFLPPSGGFLLAENGVIRCTPSGYSITN